MQFANWNTSFQIKNQTRIKLNNRIIASREGVIKQTGYTKQ